MRFIFRNFQACATEFMETRGSLKGGSNVNVKNVTHYIMLSKKNCYVDMLNHANPLVWSFQCK